MRLLLDEPLSPDIAKQLRADGHDAVAVADAELRQQTDEAVFAWAVTQRRAVVTRNVRDFRPIHARYLSKAETHYGLVRLTGRHSLAAKGIGELVRALADLLRRWPDDDALISQELWL